MNKSSHLEEFSMFRFRLSILSFTSLFRGMLRPFDVRAFRLPGCVHRFLALVLTPHLLSLSPHRATIITLLLVPLITLALLSSLSLPVLAQREACTPWHTEDSGISNPIHYLNAIAVDESGRMITVGRDSFLDSSDVSLR